ncbi:MAG TPA: hypothetical protein VHQ87_13640, partial [Rhizobacter sp.]|nr:hypothetical protein [Rhizobacter sp.]
MAAHLTGQSLRRWLAAVGLVLAVLAGHFGAVDFVAEQARQLALVMPMPPRMEVVYVREMALATPPPTRAAVAPVRRRAAAAAPPAAAAAASAPLLPEPPPAEAPAPAAPVAEAPPAPEPAASAPTAPPFEWPVSTR